MENTLSLANRRSFFLYLEKWPDFRTGILDESFELLTHFTFPIAKPSNATTIKMVTAEKSTFLGEFSEPFQLSYDKLSKKLIRIATETCVCTLLSRCH